MEYLCSKKGSKLSQQIIITYSPLDFLWSNTLLVRRTKNVSIKQWALPCYSKKYQINWHTLNFCSKNWKSEKIEFIYLQIKSLLFQSQNNIKTLLVKESIPSIFTSKVQFIYDNCKSNSGSLSKLLYIKSQTFVLNNR